MKHVTVEWLLGERAEDREVAVFLAVDADGARRATARLNRRELEERVAGMGEECPAYYAEALEALRGRAG